MLCPVCHHEVPPPPPLEADYDDPSAYRQDKAQWERAAISRTREWGFCECARCAVCWDLSLAVSCHCTPSTRAAAQGAKDVVSHDPYRNA